MTTVVIENLTRKFNDFIAVDDVNLEIPDGKFVCLLGPSGCGKTTLLRLVAGLVEPTTGQVRVDGVDQSGIPAHKRNFGMVFQSLALFPHLDVAGNIAYPLKIRGVDRKTRLERAQALLELVKLPGTGDRQIHQLSGGQRQRVAIARGLAIDPKLFLLDEPLSALDAKLREHMQIELRQLQKELGVTTIVVTHDQREAMTMADIVIVMDRGKILQSGPPIEIYRKPANSFVAGFIGTSNLLRGRLVSSTVLKIQDQTFELDTADCQDIPAGNEIFLLVRPEDVAIVEDVEAGDLRGTVEFIRDLGSSVEISVRVADDLEILSVSTPKSRPDVRTGQTVGLAIQPGRCTVMAS